MRPSALSPHVADISPPHDTREPFADALPPRGSRLPSAAGSGVAVIGVLVLLGWRFDVVFLKSVVDDFAPMQPIVALAFVLAGVALQLVHSTPRRESIARALATLPALLGAVTLVEVISGWDLGIDDLLFADELHASEGPLRAGRMAVTSAVCFIAEGVGLGLSTLSPPRVRATGQILALIGVGIAGITLMGYAYSLQPLYDGVHLGRMAVHTGATMMVLGAGVASIDRTVGPLRILSSAGPGGMLARHLMPFVLFAPFLLGWLRLQGQRAGLYGTEVGVAILAASGSAVFTAAVLVYAKRTDRLDAAREAAAGRLRAADELRRQILASAQEGIIVFDTDARYVLWNPFMQRLYGLSEADVLGKHVLMVFPTDSEVRMNAILRALAGETVAYDNERKMPNGDRRWLSAVYTPLQTEAGAIGGVIVTVRDITDRKRIEQQLREAHERTSAALAAAGMGVWELDLNQQRLTWSQNLAPLFDRPVEDLAERPDEWLRYVHSEDVERLRDALRRVSLDRPFAVEYRVTTDSKSKWLSSVGHVVRDASGKPVRLVGVTTDVTERRSLEAQFRQAQKMEGVGQLAGGVAHDFNNVLTAILGYSQFLAERLRSPQDQADIKEIIDAAQRAAALTQQLLTFSRNRVVETAFLDVNLIVQELVPMLRRLIGEDIQFITTLSPEPATIVADRGQIEQVLVNLIVNARDAMPHGGHMRVDVSRTEVDGDGASRFVDLQPGSYVVLAVADTGTGMTDETKARLFEPFYTTKAPGKGTGLGLSTVYGIVTQNKGHIAVESELGHGTTFRIYLPFATRAAQTAAVAVREPAQAPATLGRARAVLLAEDDPGVRVLVRTILDLAGYRVFESDSLEAAEQMYDRIGPVDLLLTDMVMPGGRGVDLFKHLVAKQPSLRVLYISGYTDDQMIDESLFDGAALLQKPFSAAALLRKMHDLLGV